MDWPLWGGGRRRLGFCGWWRGRFAPMEYEWGNGGRQGTKGEQCFGLSRASLKFGESYNLFPHLKFQTYCGLGVGRSCQVSQMWTGYISAEHMGV